MQGAADLLKTSQPRRPCVCVISATSNLTDLKLRHAVGNREMSLDNNFSENLRQKTFSQNFARFYWARNCQKNITYRKLHHGALGPEMSLESDVKQNLRRKVFRHKFLIFLLSADMLETSIP